VAKYRHNVEQRFGKSVVEIEQELEVVAIFVIFGVTFSSLTIQILSDILGSKSGHPKGPRRGLTADGTPDPQVVKFFCTNNDLVWPNTFPVPRFGTKMFTTCMNSVFQAYYGFGIDMVFYGKPQKASFDYCEKLMRERARLQGIEISHFYMIGDTPESDI
jgi:ribonucleotide monophosphatase NagD (HAD superfamily)